MGTDIHPIIQLHTADGWLTVGHGPTDPEPHWDGRAYPVLFHRNYSLFAILGNVRNGFGFGGVETASPVTPIQDNRGIPEDVGDPGQSYYGDDEEHWFGDHSHGWVTLRELQRYPWDEPRCYFGVLPVAAYEAWVKEHPDHDVAPSGYSGGVLGESIVTLEERDYLVEKPHIDPHGTKLYVRTSWMQPHRVYCAGFVDVVIPWLEDLAARNHVGPDDVRIVFGFDS